MKIALKLIPFLIVAFSSLNAAGESTLFNPEKGQIFVNNRIIAQVNGKAISVVDVMKKMDILFFRQFPQYSNIEAARLQFYKNSWKRILQDLIDKELLMADAEEIKMPIKDGDVRQEIETMFGPNIIANLDKVGLSYEEAWQIVHDDLVIRRMIYIRANAKALKNVTPQQIKVAYEQYAKENTHPAEWIYNVISIRSTNAEKSAEAANYAYHYLTENKRPLEDLAQTLEAIPSFQEDLKITISDTYTHVEKELSENFKEVLLSMNTDSFSYPTLQKSRNDRSTLYRIFYLKEQKNEKVPTFNEVAGLLKNRLLDIEVEKETSKYLKKLRERYHAKEEYLELIPETFEPFVIR